MVQQTVPLVCRVCRSVKETLPRRDDPQGTVSILSRCFDCGQKDGHSPVKVEYINASGFTIKSNVT